MQDEYKSPFALALKMGNVEGEAADEVKKETPIHIKVQNTMSYLNDLYNNQRDKQD